MNKKSGNNFSSGEDSKLVMEMFDNIADTYDLLNGFMSMGIDNRWRKKGLSSIPMEKRGNLLDIGCGTGDLAFMALKMNYEKVVCADISFNMLKVNRKRQFVRFKRLRNLIVNSNAEKLPFKTESFSSIIAGFSIRNVHDREKAVKDAFRVLQRGGVFVVLEFSMPSSKIIYKIYNFYFNKIIPFIGSIVSGNRIAYKYFPKSVKNFPQPSEFIKLLSDSGFSSVKSKSLSFGITTLYTATKGE
ncbi:MAG: bifunctional demethylmenaquinone methyltransferase/2-methoxy-6-polyprenyl-1,4-benzoquinol methylase UbiE [Candidatus Delongbacteria bacterium]|nr:bifunctional demethylmenaquinone methyltransferase/2-methoxy-6-polyprenyl-1,4-benzoquinol methylase UbiE [Candidatus Delongbacteria bacterium]MBN2834170.1 bifunctional demethylmenaquinone methyltransferase/2-methoxy-6-polyprenyl-1,4-benzoquinol methylase UbiE [Candidatus Delongbacteria bacterium]